MWSMSFFTFLRFFLRATVGRPDYHVDRMEFIYRRDDLCQEGTVEQRDWIS
jgi:hypothetical protein